MKKTPNPSSADRLREALTERGMKTTELAKALKVTDQTLNNWKKRGVPGYMLTKTANALRVPRQWLESGEGEINAMPTSVDRRSADYQLGELSPWDSSTPLDSDEVEVPLYKEVELASGVGRTSVEVDSGRKLRFSAATLRACGVDPANAACATNTGNSNHPLILHNATVGVDRGMTKVLDGEIYAIDHNGYLRIKIVKRRPGGGLILHSFNDQEYPDEHYTEDEVSAQQIIILGRVFWWSTIRAPNSTPL
jgi:phage repressor protein C with HTH and peptisase S24 domain